MSLFRIRAFASFKHARVPRNKLLKDTWHDTLASVQLEMLAWQARMKRGEVSRVELVDLRPEGPMTNLNVTADTELNWR